MDLVWDKEKGELRVFGRRHAVVDVQALCDHLDSLVGPVVSEVIMNNHESRLGREDAERLLETMPQASFQDLIDRLIESDRLTGMGVTRVILPKNPQDPIIIEKSNPCVKGTTGGSKAFISSWWCGILSTLLKRDLEVGDVTYDERTDRLKTILITRGSKPAAKA